MRANFSARARFLLAGDLHNRSVFALETFRFIEVRRLCKTIETYQDSRKISY
jgi:hypothetical protein